MAITGPPPEKPANPNPETGELSMFDGELARCPQPVYRRTLEQCPIANSPLTGGVILTRYEDVIWALRHPEVFSSEMEVQMDLGTVRPMIPQQIDPPMQTKFRKILDPRFSRKRMLEIEPGIRADAAALVERVIDEGKCEFNSAFAVPLPCNAFLHLMGLPEDQLDLFLEFKDGIIRPHMKTNDLGEMQKVRKETGRRIYQYFEDLIAERREAPRDDLMTYFLNAEVGGEKLTNNDILDICFLFLLAGLDTVTATLGCNVAYLAANPGQRQKLVANPQQLDGAVEELLRWETPVMAIPRVVKRDVTVDGNSLAKGDMVTLLLGASNVDEAKFESADQVDFERESNKHLAFGAGPHRCLGSHLARMELRVALEEWHKRIPDYEIAAGTTPIYSPGIREVQQLHLVWPTR